MYLKILFHFILSQSLNVFCDTQDYTGWLKIKINHSLNCNDSDEFCYRGTIRIKSFKNKNFVVEQKNLRTEDLEELKYLADVDDFYTMRTEVISGNNKGSNVFLSSVKARNFLNNGLRDIICIWMQSNGHPMAVSFIASKQQRPMVQLKNQQHKIISKVILRQVSEAPEPDVLTYKQKLKKEQEEKEENELNNQSFIAKYWLYFAVFLVFIIVSGATNAEDA